MLHISDDIDEIFQKAAEEYPLKTGKPDWERMQQKLLSQVAAEKNKGYGKLRLSFLHWAAFVLFMLIPLSTVVKELISDEVAVVKNEPQKIDIKSATLTPGYTDMVFNPLTSMSGKEKTFANSIQSANNSSGFVTATNDKFPITQQSLINNNDALLQNNQGYNLMQPEIINGSVADIVANTERITAIDLQEEKKNKITLQDEKETKLIKIKNSSSQRFYGGIFITSELTSVKGQSFRKPGFNGGFLAGYNINKKFQAEVGLVLSRKYYYSDGKYITPDILRQDDLPIGGVNVYSQIAEIPVTLRYNIKNTGNDKLFVAAGTVTNITAEERYNYGYTKNGHTKKGFKKYDESTNNLVSNVHLSIGYEHNLGTIGDIRIEPYYRLPLNGIGAGNLPVTSAGINIGIIKHFK